MGQDKEALKAVVNSELQDVRTSLGEEGKSMRESILRLGKDVELLTPSVQKQLEEEREKVEARLQQVSRVANDHDRDQIVGLDCRQQSIPIDFWLKRPQKHDRDIV